MALYPRLPSSSGSGEPEPSSRRFPSGRYTRTNPLRRKFNLKRLSEPLPEPLRTTLIRTWRHRIRYDGNQAIQSLHREHPSAASLARGVARALGWFTLAELEVARRIVEAPSASISRDTRNRLLSDQGTYLHGLYAALLERPLPWPNSSAWCFK